MSLTPRFQLQTTLSLFDKVRIVRDAALALDHAHAGEEERPLYAAPETAAAGVSGPQADVWALGVTLYWLLTARFPAETEHPSVAVQPLEASAFAPDVPPRISRACLRALEPDPARRHPSASALAHDLDRWLLGAWSRRCQTQPPARGGPRVPARWVKFAVLWFALFALLAAAATILVGVAQFV